MNTNYRVKPCILHSIYCTAIIAGTIIASIDSALDFLSKVILYGGMIIFIWYICSKKFELKKFLKSEREKLNVRGVNWERGPSSSYLHLCVGYPQFYNPRGGWNPYLILFERVD